MSLYRIASGRALLAAETIGRGDPVVFLHAAIGDRRMWRAQLDDIGATHKAIAYDRRGFGETRAEAEDFSAVGDLMAVIDALADGRPVILVGCSEGGRIVIDAALRHPAAIRGIVLIAPSVSGAPDAVYPPEIEGPMARMKAAQSAGDLEQVKAIKARLFLDGPRQPEGRVAGAARRLFFEMNDIVLRAPPIGSNRDGTPAFDRLGEIAALALVLWGDADFPNIQARSRHVAATLPYATGREIAGAAHLPSLEQPAAVTDLLAGFIGRCPR